MTEKEERKKLITAINKIWDSMEYKERRKRHTRYLDYYCGDYWPDDDNEEEKKESRIFANMLFSTIMTIAPLLTDNKPIWSITTELPFLQPLADVYKAAGDSVWEIENMDEKIFALVLDALIYGYGIAQVYFNPDKSVRGEISIEPIDPRTYGQAEGFEDNWDCPFCFTKTTRSLWWIRKNFPDTGKEVKPEADKRDEDRERKIGGLSRAKADFEYLNESASVYTIWMQDDSVMDYITKDDAGKNVKKQRKKYPNGRFMVITEEVTLEDKAYEYNHGKPPWVILKDYVVPHRFDGMGECQQLEGLVLEYNLALRELCTHSRMYARPDHVVDAGSGIDSNQYKRGLLSKRPNVWTKNTGTDKPEPIEHPLIDPSALQLINGLPTVMQEVSGVTEVSKGMAGKKQRQSAHEISALLETSYTRTRQRVRNLESFIKRLYILVIEIMQQYYNVPRNFALKNTDRETEWYNIENSKQFAKNLMKPQEPFIEKPNMEEDQEYTLAKQQNEDYKELLDLLEKITDEEAVQFGFQVIIETNSTLPMDQQSLANLGIRLGEQGRLDTLSLLETLHWPKPQEVVDRLKEEAAARQQEAPQQIPGGAGGGGM